MRMGERSWESSLTLVLHVGMRLCGYSLIRAITLTSDTLADSENMGLTMEIQRIDTLQCFLYVRPSYLCVCVHNTYYYI